MDSRNTAFEKHWASQWVDFDDTETTERRKRIAKSAFDAGWSASLTDEVLDSIHANAKAEALKEAAERATEWVRNMYAKSLYYDDDDLREYILADEPKEKL